MAEPDSLDESLAIARRALRASAANKARVRALLDASRAAGEPSAAARGSRFIERLKRPLTVGVLVGSGFVAGYWLGRHPESDPLARAGARATDGEAPAPAAARPSEAEPDSSPAVTSTESVSPARALAAETRPAAPTPPRARPSARATNEAPAPRGAQRRPPAPASAAASDPFLEELALLARVDRAIRASEPELALTLLDELERRHPRSSLGEERAAARLLADCLLREPSASARAERFVREQAGSVYVERVRSACGVEARAPEPAPAPNAEGSRGSGH